MLLQKHFSECRTKSSAKYIDFMTQVGIHPRNIRNMSPSQKFCHKKKRDEVMCGQSRTARKWKFYVSYFLFWISRYLIFQSDMWPRGEFYWCLRAYCKIFSCVVDSNATKISYFDYDIKFYQTVGQSKRWRPWWCFFFSGTKKQVEKFATLFDFPAPNLLKVCSAGQMQLL